jgi:acetyl esterase
MKATQPHTFINADSDLNPDADPASLTPAMNSVLENMRRANRPAIHTLSPAEAKTLYAKGADILEVHSPHMHSEETYQVSALDGHRILLKLWRPVHMQSVAKHGTHHLAPALIYFHGGGFTIGSIETHATLCKVIAKLSQMPVISVEYRLAPEFTFPVAHNDAWSACEWIFKNATDLRLSAKHLFVGGDSAGGTLSLYCAQQAGLTGSSFRGQILYYPGCADNQNMPSHKAYAVGYLLEQKSIDYFYGLYLAGPDRTRLMSDWRFSALCSPHLKLLPTTWIGLAQCDPLRDEGTALVHALKALGCKVKARIYKGVIHGFVKMGRFIPEAVEAHVDASDFLRSFL